MQEHDDTLECQEALSLQINELEQVNKQIAVLLLRKEQLTESIISCFGHEHEGQKTYEYDVWRLEVKTPFVYSLNKKAYEEDGVGSLPDPFNPIKQSIAYSIDKKMLQECMEKAPDYVRDILVELIDKKPGKASVVIKERV